MNNTNSSFSDEKIYFLLLLIIILGSFLRFFGLEIQSFWHDELHTANRINFDNIIDVIKSVAGNVQSPEYFTLLYYFKKFAGDSEIALRIPSAVFGSISIFITFLLTRKLYTYREALISSILMAVLWCPIYYSQEARPYSLLLMFTLLSTYFWIIILQNSLEYSKKKLEIWAYIISAVLTCYIHYFGLLLISLQGLFFLLLYIRNKKKIIRIIFIYSLIVVAYSPWLFIAWEDLGRDNFWAQKPRLIFAPGLIRYYFNGSNLILVFVLLSYLYLFVKKTNSLFFNKNNKAHKFSFLDSDILLFLWLSIPFAIAYLKSSISASVMVNRYLIISLPPAYLLLSRSITQLPIRRTLQNSFAIILVIFFLFHLIFIKDYYSRMSKEQYRESVNYIFKYDKFLSSESIIVANNNLHNYYLEKNEEGKKIDLIVRGEKDIPNLNKFLLKNKPKYIWYVHSHKKTYNHITDNFKKSLKLVEHKKFHGSRVWLYKNRSTRK